MIENEKIKEQFKIIAEYTNESYANITMMNSLKMLGLKKAEAKEELTEKDYKLLNSYKYPDRLVKMMELNSARFQVEGFFSQSFARFALTEHNIKF